MGRIHIDVPKEKLAAFCRLHHVRKLALFGSVLSENFQPGSDVDVLVEFEPGHFVGYFGIARMERELAELLGRAVDLRTPAELSPYIRDEVVRSSVVQYAQG